MNKKGFMMAEVVVVSSIVLVAIIGLYTAYNKIYKTYNTRLNYYDVTTLYRLGYYRDILIENNKINETINEVNEENKAIVIYTTNGFENIFNLPDSEKPNYITDSVYLVPTIASKKIPNKKEVADDALKNHNVNLTFNEYLSFLSNSTTFESDYLMLMERCTKDKDNKVNIDDCKYAYLEIYEERVKQLR